MKYCKPKLSFFIFTSYERSECFMFGVKRKMLHNEVASSEKAGPDWVKHAFRRMKHFAALPQNMKHLRCGMKQSLFRLHVFLPWNQGKKKWRKECHPRCFLFYCLFYALKHWLSSIHSRIFTKISKKLNLIKKALNGTFYLQNGTKRHLLLKRYLPGNLPFRIVRQHNNFQPRIFVSVPADNLT